MTFVLTLAALRRHSFSIAVTALLVTISASLVGASVPLALVVWTQASFLSLLVWRRLEAFVLRRINCRSPSRLECERLELVAKCAELEVLVVDSAKPWLRSGLRSLVISRGLLDLLEDRALVGLLSQAAQEVPSASLAGEIVVWLGNLPLLSTWLVAGWIAQLGRLLAMAVGGSLVLPLLLWPVGFVRWVGRFFGWVIVGLLGAAMVSSGLASAGLGLLLAWAIVPGVKWLLAWETRRAETLADDAAIEAGLGWQLVEALETLVWAEAMPTPDGVIGLLQRGGRPLQERADRIWRALSMT